MKKTISTLLALCTCTAAVAENITINPQVTPAIGSGDIANVLGWQQSLQSDSLVDPSTALTATVNLHSIGIMTAKDVSAQVPDNATVKLEIYESYADGSWTGLVGTSTNTVSYATDSALTFKFSDVVISSTDSYAFRFVSTDTHEDIFRVSMSKTPHGADEVIIPHGDTPSWLPNYSPYAVYEVSNITTPVPEPATATLSLLALAGLAARRRRK